MQRAFSGALTVPGVFVRHFNQTANTHFHSWSSGAIAWLTAGDDVVSEFIYAMLIDNSTSMDT